MITATYGKEGDSREFVQFAKTVDRDRDRYCIYSAFGEIDGGEALNRRFIRQALFGEDITVLAFRDDGSLIGFIILMQSKVMKVDSLSAYLIVQPKDSQPLTEFISFDDDSPQLNKIRCSTFVEYPCLEKECGLKLEAACPMATGTAYFYSWINEREECENDA